MAKKKAGDDVYQLTLKVGKEAYKSGGATFPEAMRNLKYGKINGKIWLFVKKGDLERPFQFNYIRWRLLFAKELYMDVFEKKVKMFVG